MIWPCPGWREGRPEIERATSNRGTIRRRCVLALITCLLLPYLYYGGKDQAYHFTGRRVPLVEHLLHLFIGMTMFAGIWNAYRGRMSHFVASVALFLVVGAG